MPEKLQSLALLLTAVGALSGVIIHLYNRVNKLNDKITDLQEQFRNEIVGLHEKTIAMLPSHEKNIIDSHSNLLDKVVSRIDAKHSETQQVIKENRNG